VKKKPRATLPKKIAGAFKSGERDKAMDLAVYGRETTALTDLARDLCWLCRLQLPSNKKAAISMSSGGERLGIFEDAPRRQSLRQRTQCFERWKNYKEKELQAKIDTGEVWYGKNFWADLERECRRVFKKDARVQLFRPGSTKSDSNWIRQVLIANMGMENLLKKKSYPLTEIAKQSGRDVRNVRRIARDMGAKPGKAGTPKRRKTTPLI
jgi:hypothetical protein